MTWEYALIGLVVGIIIGAVAMRFGNRKPVSYTHLTLPTTAIVCRSRWSPYH